MFIFHPIRTIKKIISFLCFLLLLFVVVNFWALLDWGEYALMEKYPRIEGLADFVRGDQDEPLSGDFILSIDKIDVVTPIVEVGSVEEGELKTALEQGVVLYPDAGLPGKPGNMVLTGHSSNYWWQDGDYKTVFSLLPALEEGDVVTVTKNNQIWKYQVKEKKIVTADAFEVLKSDSQGTTLTLLTCWPPGSTWRRLAITADLVP